MRRSPLPVLLLTAALGQASAHLATVLPGDTLSGLAVRFGVSSRSIADANHLVGSNPELRAGQTLDIPGAAHYTVQPGDTPWSIAQRADMPLTQLEALNPSIASGMVQVGMVLQLSGTALPAVQAAPAKAAAVAATSYVVRSGDTLWGIAQKLGISVATLTALNPQAATAMLQPGMILKLRGRPAPPSLPTSGYRVASGDTLWGIASSLGISVAELERLNPQTVYQNLQPGTVLRVPAQVQAKSSPAKAPAIPTSGYRVASGDTLWGIASSLGISVAELLRLNPEIASSTLVAGSTLQVPARPGKRKRPAPAPTNQIPGLRLGDVLDSIPLRFRGSGQLVPEQPVHVLHQARAVEAGGGATPPDVGDTEEALGDRHHSAPEAAQPVQEGRYVQLLPDLEYPRLYLGVVRL